MKLICKEKIFILICFLIYFIWSISFPFNSAPDELGRYLVPQYIFNNHSLPTATTLETIIPLWGFSYAAYPYLMSIISSVFMFIVGNFTSSETILLIAARFSGVLVATIHAYYAVKLGKIIFKNNKKLKILFSVALTLLPQVVYLSSYHNNDILALCTTTAIIYYWFEGLNNRWKTKTCICFAISMGICLLSYYNAYGVLLASVIMYFGSFYINRDKWNITIKTIIKKTIIIVGVVVIVSGWWFAFAYINNGGDFLGLSITKETAELFAMDEFKPSLKSTYLNEGNSLWGMLIPGKWIIYTFTSFIGVFGYMEVYLPSLIYLAFGMVILVTIASSLVFLIKRRDIIFNKANSLVISSLFIVAVTPIILSIYRSYTFDYQAQGRYIITILPVVATIICIGSQLISKHLKIKLNLEYLISCAIIMTMLYSYIALYTYLY